MHDGGMLALPILDRDALRFRFRTSVFDRDVLPLVSFEDRSDVLWCKDTNG